jgi:hypothetical protein
LNWTKKNRLAAVPGGEGGIRTHGWVAPSPDFESNASKNTYINQMLAHPDRNFAFSLQKYALPKPSSRCDERANRQTRR